jgi:lysozyme
MITKAIDVICFEEGFRATPYLCSEGVPTIGYGRVIGVKGADISLFSGKVYEESERVWLEIRVDELVRQMGLSHAIGPALRACDPNRAAILISMAYQLGIRGLSGFRKTLSAITAQDWREAYAEMLDSRWAMQTPKRASRHAEVMLTGILPDEYS